MTRVVADRAEAGRDDLRFGDPIGCGYHWADPGEVDAYGDSVRRLASRVELAVDAFERTATLSEEAFAGEAADALRARAAKRHEESELVRDGLRGLGLAINDYADVLRRHRDGLEHLHSTAVVRGLDVHGRQIRPPVETIAKDAPQHQLDAWEHAWKAYRECFETRIALRDARRAASRELVRALADHAGVQPGHDGQAFVTADAQQVSFGELRREAAEEAMEAVQAGHHAEAAQRVVDALGRREQSALDTLERLVHDERPPEEIETQADRVSALHRELAQAREEARDADVVADRELGQADRAARHLQDAEARGPRPVEAPAPAPAARTTDGRGDLSDRLG